MLGQNEEQAASHSHFESFWPVILSRLSLPLLCQHAAQSSVESPANEASTRKRPAFLARQVGDGPSAEKPKDSSLVFGDRIWKSLNYRFLPTQRPPLSSRHERIYTEQYQLNRDEVGRSEPCATSRRWIIVVLPVSATVRFSSSGRAPDHRRYEPTEAIAYDVVEPSASFSRASPIEGDRRVLRQRRGHSRDRRYRRIISIAVLDTVDPLATLRKRAEVG